MPTASPQTFVRHQNHFSHANGRAKTITMELMKMTQDSSLLTLKLSA